MVTCLSWIFFFFNDTATTEIYTLSLHDALPISRLLVTWVEVGIRAAHRPGECDRDRKSTRLNSSHMSISYAVFCLKKKKRHQSPRPCTRPRPRPRASHRPSFRTCSQRTRSTRAL